MSRASEDAAVARYRARRSAAWADMRRWAEMLTPPEVAKAWITGLRAAGLTNVQSMYYRPGRLSLPMVVEFDCPLWHDGDIAGTFGKTRLLIDGTDGSARTFPGVVLGSEEPPKAGTACCPLCSDGGGDLVPYLMTCPRCPGPRDAHPRHEWFHEHVGADPDEVGHEAYYADAQDKSPLAHVMTATRRAHGRRVGHLTGSPHKSTWTDESAARFLTEQGIDPAMSHREVWESVKGLAGRPPEKAVRGGLRALKGPSS